MEPVPGLPLALVRNTPGVGMQSPRSPTARCAGDAFTDLLEEQLAAVQRLLMDHKQRALGLLEEREQVTSQLQKELAQVHAENEKLRVRSDALGPAGFSSPSTGETGGTDYSAIANNGGCSGASASGVRRVEAWASPSPTNANAVVPIPLPPTVGLNYVSASAASSATAAQTATLIPQRIDPPAPTGDPAELSDIPGLVTMDEVVEVVSAPPPPVAAAEGAVATAAGRDICTALAIPALVGPPPSVPMHGLRCPPGMPVFNATTDTTNDGEQPELFKSCILGDGAAGNLTNIVPGMKTSEVDTACSNRTGRKLSILPTGDPPKPKAVFADANAMKEKLRNAIGKKEYHVSDFYHEKGICQKIARSSMFDNCTLSVIGINAIWIAVDTDYNEAAVLLNAHPVFIFAENAFCLYFSFEWFVRFMSFKKKRSGLKDPWFVFDSALVSTMVLETWFITGMLLVTGATDGGGGLLGNASILKLFRLLRLSRMARMARLLRAMPELMIMIKGMAIAMRSVFFCVALLMGIIYVFAIAFVQMAGDSELGEEGGPFESVSVTMNTLLLDGTLPDQAAIVTTVAEVHPVLRYAMLLYILLASLTVMNMLVGVLCEVVSVVSAVEKEQMLINFVKEELQDLLRKTGIDADGDNMISRSEFEALLEKQDAAKALQEVGVDVVGLIDFTDFIFEKGHDLSFADFMDVVLQLRGSNVATVKDIVDLRKLCMTNFALLNDYINKAEGKSDVAGTPSLPAYHP